MRKILSFLLAAATVATLACTTPDPGSSNGQPSPGNSETSAPILASVTVPLTVFPSTAFPATDNAPQPPSWGFYGLTDEGDGGNSIAYHDYYIPIAGVPVGSTLTQVKARVASGPYNGCQVYVWRQTDYLHVDTAPLGISGTNVAFSVATLTANLNVATQDLVQYFVTVHSPNAVANVSCAVAAAQVTYTPGA